MKRARGFGRYTRGSRVREASGLLVEDPTGVDPGKGTFFPWYEEAGENIVGCG
jgi:hypothetical protein